MNTLERYSVDAADTNQYEAFLFTLPAGTTTVAVTYPDAYSVGTAPVVVCTPQHQTSFWVTSRTNTGFNFNVGTTSGYDQDINCMTSYVT